MRKVMEQSIAARVMLPQGPIPFSTVRDWVKIANYPLSYYRNSTDFIGPTASTVVTFVFVYWNSDFNERSARILLQTKYALGANDFLIVVGEHDYERDVVIALDIGADRFIRADTSYRILDAMINAALLKMNRHTRIECLSPYTTDSFARTFIVENQVIKLSPKEFDLAYYLLKHNHKFLSRAELLRNVWDLPALTNNRRVDNLISRVKRKLKFDGTYGYQLRSHRSKGYRLDSFNSQTK